MLDSGAARRCIGLAGVLVACLMPAACRDQPLPAPAVPTSLSVRPLPRDRLPAPTGAPGPRAAPTWTLPPGVAPADRGSSTAGVPVAAPPATAFAGAMPLPTDAPPVAVPDGGPPVVDPEIVALMNTVSSGRLSADVRRLVGFQTRHPLSATDDRYRGVGAARDWLRVQLASAGRAGRHQVHVEFEDFDLELPPGNHTTQRNVIATMPGSGHTKRFVYVTAHYDSRVADLLDGQSKAPGADDNASGTAALLELARVLSARQWDASVRLVAFAAEEQGLFGSRHHAPGAAAFGLPIEAVVNNDIIGGSSGSDGATDLERVRAFSAGPGDGPSRRLARYAHVVARRYGGLEVVVEPLADREGREGDHQSFSAAGFPAIRLISAQEDMGRQHGPGDTADRLDSGYHAAVVRLDVALVANLALAPPAPVGAPRLEDVPGGLLVAWDAVPDPRVAGYWLAVRGPGEAAYRELVWAGAGPEHTVAGVAAGESVVVAVAASDDRGHMSLFGPEAAR